MKGKNKMKTSVKTAAFICACALTFGAFTLPAAEGIASPTVTVSAETSKLSAPSDLRTSMSRGALVIEWKEVKGADEYRIDLKRGNAKKFEEAGKVDSGYCSVNGLNNGEKVSVRITPLKKTKDGYKEGTPATITKKYKGEVIYITDNGMFYVDPSLLNVKFSAFTKKTGLEYREEETDVFGDNIKYVAVPTTEGTEGAFAVLLDKDKVVKSVFTDVPGSELDGSLSQSVCWHYGNGFDMKEIMPDEMTAFDVFYQWQVDSETVFFVCDYKRDGSKEIYIRQQYDAYDFTK